MGRIGQEQGQQRRGAGSERQVVRSPCLLTDRIPSSRPYNSATKTSLRHRVCATTIPKCSSHAPRERMSFELRRVISSFLYARDCLLVESTLGNGALCAECVSMYVQTWIWAPKLSDTIPSTPFPFSPSFSVSLPPSPSRPQPHPHPHPPPSSSPSLSPCPSPCRSPLLTHGVCRPSESTTPRCPHTACRYQGQRRRQNAPGSSRRRSKRGRRAWSRYTTTTSTKTKTKTKTSDSPVASLGEGSRELN